jgi:cytochrome b6-f complex iron-sulfur subunit
MPEVTEASTQTKTTEPTGSEVTGSPPEPGVIEPPAEISAVLKPQAPERKRTPEEIRAQREAFLAAKAAKADGTTAPTPPGPVAKPAEPAPAQPPAARPVEVDKSKPVPKPAPAAPALSPTAATNINRREFLNYAWLASIALFAIETAGLSLWFAFPNFKPGQFGGQFAIGAVGEVLPEVNAAPIPYTDGKFWLVDLDTTNRHGEPRKGILALYKVCTHLGCLYDWVPVTNRFECPCHGSKFELTGDYIEGPARRSLDRFVIQAVAPDGLIKETDAEGNSLVINGDETLIIDTGQRILGAAVA